MGDSLNHTNPFECPCCRTFYDENTIPCTLPCGHSMCITHIPMFSECLICKEPFPNGNNPDSFVPSVALAAGAIQYRNTFNVMSDLIRRQALTNCPPPVARANAQQSASASASQSSPNGGKRGGHVGDSKTQHVEKQLAASKNSRSGSLRDCVADESSTSAEPNAATAAFTCGHDINLEGTLQTKSATDSMLLSSSAAAVPVSAPGPSPAFAKLNFKTVAGAMQAQEGNELEASGVFSSEALKKQASNAVVTSSANALPSETSLVRNHRSGIGSDINNSNISSASTVATHIIPPAAQASASASVAQDAAHQSHMSSSNANSITNETKSAGNTRNSTSSGFGSSIFNTMKSVISGPAAASASAQASESMDSSLTKSMAARALPAARASASASAAASDSADESEPFSNLEQSRAFKSSSSSARNPPPPASASASAPPAELINSMREFNTLMLSNTTSNGVDLEGVVRQVLANQQQQQQSPFASADAAAAAAPAPQHPSSSRSSLPSNNSMKIKNLGDDSDLCENSISIRNSWKGGGGLLDAISDKSLSK